MLTRAGILVALIAVACSAVAQQPKTEPPKFIPPLARLQAAKTVYLKNAGGNEVPYNVIESAIEGWGRYTFADSPDKADLIVEVSAPQESGASVSSTVTSDSPGGKSTTTSTKDLSVISIKMSVLDAHNKVMLWSGTERPKGGFKQKAREDNLIESSLKLFRQFRARVEPESAVTE